MKLKRGQKVKLFGMVVRGEDRNGHVHVRVRGMESDKAVSVETEDVKRRWGK